MIYRKIFCTAALLITVSTSAFAQQWYVETQAGRIRSVLDSSSVETANVLMGIRYDHPFASLRVSAGVPTSKQDSGWGSVGAWKRLNFRNDGIYLGLDLSANGFLLGDGHAIAGQALPVVGFDKANFEVRGRAGVSLYGSSFGTQKFNRRVGLADAQVTYTPEASFAITPVVRAYQAEEGSYTYAGVTAVAGHGRATVWGTAGSWIQTGISQSDGAPWAVGATVRISPRVSVNASRRRDTVDPLYLTPPQHSWAVGVSFQFAGPTYTPQPFPAAYVEGRATIELPASESATSPRIAGDFNNWRPQPMELVGRRWTYRVNLATGVYNYAFVNDKGEWFVPKNVAGRRDDGMGGYVAVLVVR